MCDITTIYYICVSRANCWWHSSTRSKHICCIYCSAKRLCDYEEVSIDCWFYWWPWGMQIRSKETMVIFLNSCARWMNHCKKAEIKYLKIHLFWNVSNAGCRFCKQTNLVCHLLKWITVLIDLYESFLLLSNFFETVLLNLLSGGIEFLGIASRLSLKSIADL